MVNYLYKHLNRGGALTCDVNGDNIYDERTERFYYITDKDAGTAVLIYYTNVENGVASSTAAIEYSLNTTQYIGPTQAISYLPTTSQWKLSSPGKRNIKDENGITRVTSFDYSKYAARLMTMEEVGEACGGIQHTSSQWNYGVDQSKCLYLYEDVNFSNDEGAYWLENEYVSGSGNSAFIFSSIDSIYDMNHDAKAAVRPVIEVSKHDISLK